MENRETNLFEVDFSARKVLIIQVEKENQLNRHFRNGMVDLVVTPNSIPTNFLNLMTSRKNYPS